MEHFPLRKKEEGEEAERVGMPMVAVHRGVAILLPAALRSLPHGRRIAESN